MYSVNTVKIQNDKNRKTCKFRKKSPSINAQFLLALSTVELNEDRDVDISPQEEFDLFYGKLLNMLNQFYPEQAVTMTGKDPEYLSPSIKADLKKKNKLMRKEKIEEAGALAKRIGVEIARRNANTLRHIGNNTSSRDLWTAVNKIKNRTKNEQTVVGINAEILNKYYADISHDNNHVKPPYKHTTSSQMAPFSEYEIFNILDKLKPTASGLDQLPAWFLRLGAPVLAKHIARLFNRSIDESVVPCQWKRAYIKPIPKVSTLSVPADFRPISVTPILSRVMERMIVSKFIYPAFVDPPAPLSFSDQFALKPAGSTTAALIAILDAVTTMLQTNTVVIVIALDFSKAFDTVRHSTLMEKMKLLDMPDCIYNWIVNFLTDHEHCTI